MFHTLGKDVRDQALLEVAKLPQVVSGAIPEDRIEKWLNQVAKIDPLRIGWHVRRLGGIGGSEIASVMGLQGAYSTPEIIAKQKLMIIPPFRPTAAMKRGAVSEAFIRDLFEGPAETSTELEMAENLRSNAMSGVIHDLFSSEMDARFGPGNWKPRPDLEAIVQRPPASGRKLPNWTIGSPDRIYEVRMQGRAYVVPVDFKAPSEETMAKIKRNPEKLAPWRAQVQYYGMILDEAGYPPSALVLAVFDYANVGTTTFLLDETVPVPSVCADMIRAGNDFWNGHVLTGILPKPAAPEVVQLPPELENAAARSTYFTALREAAASVLDEVQAGIRDWVMANPAERGNVSLGLTGGMPMWNPRVKEEFDSESAIFRLIDAGHMTAEESLKLRGPAEPIPSNDPRFAASITVAKEKLDALSEMVGGLTPGGSLSAATLEKLTSVLSEATYCANPHRLGKPQDDLVKEALLAVGEPTEPYSTHKLTLARSAKKAAANVFRGITHQARDIVVAYSDRCLQDDGAKVDEARVQADITEPARPRPAAGVTLG